jgi:hypothetical protein
MTYMVMQRNSLGEAAQDHGWGRGERKKEREREREKDGA